MCQGNAQNADVWSGSLMYQLEAGKNTYASWECIHLLSERGSLYFIHITRKEWNKVL